MKAGIVIYRRAGHQLIGQWSHERVAGALANEIVHNVTDEGFQGDWPVEIFLPGGELLFTGRLRLVPFGACVRLDWEGVLSSGEQARFEGIGYASDRNFLSATFEEVAAEP